VNRIADAPNGRLWFAGPQSVAVYDLKLDQ
jgi:hypothetical protein